MHLPKSLLGVLILTAAALILMAATSAKKVEPTKQRIYWSESSEQLVPSSTQGVTFTFRIDADGNGVADWEEGMDVFLTDLRVVERRNLSTVNSGFHTRKVHWLLKDQAGTWLAGSGSWDTSGDNSMHLTSPIVIGNAPGDLILRVYSIDEPQFDLQNGDHISWTICGFSSRP